MPGKLSKYATPQILPDLPIKAEQDQKANELANFHFKEYAITLARLVADKQTKTPLTIGVSGAWGTGKTTLLTLVREMLDQTTCLEDTKLPNPDFLGQDEFLDGFRKCKTVWFNAWKYSDEDELLVALVRVMVQTMFADDFISKGAAAIFNPFADRRDVIETVLGWFSIKTPFGVEIKPTPGEARPAPLSEKIAVLDLFDDAFHRLMGVWVHRQLSPDVTKIDPKQGVLVIFIDDLDRCLPAKTVQVLEAVKLFLDKPGCVFVLGADVTLIQQAVREHYKSMDGHQADDYIEKIIQLRFNLPLIAQTHMDAYVRDQISADSPLYKHWRTIVAGAESNLRKVKTSLNDLQLRWAVMQNKGETEHIDFDLFVSWEVLMRSSSRFRERMYGLRPVLDIDYELVKDLLDNAFKWAEGDEAARASFREDVTDQMQRVLREIKPMQDRFNRQSLESLLYLTALLPPPEPAPELPTPEKIPAQVEHQPEAFEIGLPAAPEQVETTKGVTRGVGRDSIPPHKPSREGAIVVGNMEFMLVPKGKFIMGSKNDDKDADDYEKPQHTVEIPYDYWLARFTVTNEQFGRFVKATGYQTTAEQQGSAYAYNGKEWKDTKGANWQHPRGPKSGIQDRADHPVVSVSWLDAMEYVKWLTGEMRFVLQNDPRLASLVFRLPTEAEWEKAARGVYGNIYPWGNEFDPSRCNSLESGKMDTVPVNAFPHGASPYGCEQMSGNVWEWTHSLFEKYPYASDEKRENETDKHSFRVLRGGSFGDHRQYVRSAFRHWYFPYFRCDYYGFRVCLAPISNL